MRSRDDVTSSFSYAQGIVWRLNFWLTPQMLEK